MAVNGSVGHRRNQLFTILKSRAIGELRDLSDLLEMWPNPLWWYDRATLRDALIDKIGREYAAIHDSRHGKVDQSRAGSQYDDYSNVGRSQSLASRANHIVEKQR